MRYRVTDIKRGTSQLFDTAEEADAAFDRIFIPRYKALVKKFEQKNGREPDETQRKRISAVITQKIVSYDLDFSDDYNEDGTLTEKAAQEVLEVMRREGIAAGGAPQEGQGQRPRQGGRRRQRQQQQGDAR